MDEIFDREVENVEELCDDQNILILSEHIEKRLEEGDTALKADNINDMIWKVNKHYAST